MPTERFLPGDLVEFLSGRGWKPGVVVPMTGVFDTYAAGRVCQNPRSVRIRVGDGVCVVRPIRRVRKVNFPIEYIAGSSPPKFRWRQVLGTAVGARTVTHEGMLPTSVESAVKTLLDIARQLYLENAELRLRVAGLAERVGAQSEIITKHADGWFREQAEKLQAFKDWVHNYLDTLGVPKEFPDGVHTQEGCRVGDRLDWLVEQLGAANRRAEAAEVLNSNQRQMLDVESSSSGKRRR